MPFFNGAVTTRGALTNIVDNILPFVDICEGTLLLK
jgi:hypothetical protein